MSLDTNRGLEPRLVEIDNMGEGNSSPSPYSLLWWLKKILEALGGSSSTTIDERSDGLVDINPISYTTLVKYDLNSGETINITQVTVSLIGMMAHFELRFYDGTNYNSIRSYVLSTQQNTFSETIEKDIVLSYIGVGSSIEIRAIMFGKNQTGKAFGVINGYK